MSDLKELEVTVSGRVQGVMFRHTVKKHADDLGLKGFVMNKDAGVVLVVVQGKEKVLRDFLKNLEEDPGLARIEAVNYRWKDVVKEYPDFRIIKKTTFVVDQAKSFMNLGKSLVGMTPAKVPKHVAVIPDGNRRWAKNKSLKESYGHYRAGSFENLSSLMKEAQDMGVRYFSIWAFSTENWKRSEEERKAIFDVILKGIKKFEKRFKEEEVRFKHMGRKDRLPRELVKAMDDLEEKTKKFDKFTAIFCLDYGGRNEIIRAVKKIVRDKVKDMGEEKFSKYLDSSEIPDPDLIIRTGGEKRLSGFMAYQSAYSELYFTDVYFPDFDSKELRKAILEYSNRQRRFGK